MSDIGKTIKARREQLGITQEELAHTLGYSSKTSINKIEMGLAGVPRTKIPAFAKALGMTPTELTGWSAEKVELGFTYCVEQQMHLLGYDVHYDGEGNSWLEHDGITIEVTGNQIRELEKRLAAYMKFMLNEIEGGDK